MKKYNGAKRLHRKYSNVSLSPVFPAKNTDSCQSIDCVQVEDRSGIQYDKSIIETNESSLDIIDIDSSNTKKVLNDGMRLKIDEKFKRRKRSVPQTAPEKTLLKIVEKNSCLTKANHESLPTPLQAFADEMMKEQTSTVPVQIKVDNKDWTVNVSKTVVSQSKSSSEFPKNREALFKALKEESYRLLKLVSKKNSIRNDVRMVFDPKENRVTPFHIHFKRNGAVSDKCVHNGELDMTKFISSDVEDSEEEGTNADDLVCGAEGVNNADSSSIKVQINGRNFPFSSDKVASADPVSNINSASSEIEIVDEDELCYYNVNLLKQVNRSSEEDTSCRVGNSIERISFMALQQPESNSEITVHKEQLGKQGILPVSIEGDNKIKTEVTQNVQCEDPLKSNEISRQSDMNNHGVIAVFKEESNQNNEMNDIPYSMYDIPCTSNGNQHMEATVNKALKEETEKTVDQPLQNIIIHSETYRIKENGEGLDIFAKSEENPGTSAKYESEYIIPDIDFVDNSSFRSSSEQINLSDPFEEESLSSHEFISDDDDDEEEVFSEDEASGVQRNDMSRNTEYITGLQSNEEVVMVRSDLPSSSYHSLDCGGKGSNQNIEMEKDPLYVDGFTEGVLFYDPETDYDKAEVNHSGSTNEYDALNNISCKDHFSNEKNIHNLDDFEDVRDDTRESHEGDMDDFNLSNKWNWSNLKKYNSRAAKNNSVKIINNQSIDEHNEKRQIEEEKFRGFSDWTDSSSKYSEFITACSKLGYYDDMVVLNQHYEVSQPKNKGWKLREVGTSTRSKEIYKSKLADDNYKRCTSLKSKYLHLSEVNRDQRKRKGSRISEKNSTARENNNELSDEQESLFFGFGSNDNYTQLRRNSIEISRRLSAEFSSNNNEVSNSSVDSAHSDGMKTAQNVSNILIKDETKQKNNVKQGKSVPRTLEHHTSSNRNIICEYEKCDEVKNLCCEKEPWSCSKKELASTTDKSNFSSRNQNKLIDESSVVDKLNIDSSMEEIDRNKLIANEESVRKKGRSRKNSTPTNIVNNVSSASTSSHLPIEDCSSKFLSKRGGNMSDINSIQSSGKNVHSSALKNYHTSRDGFPSNIMAPKRRGRPKKIFDENSSADIPKQSSLCPAENDSSNKQCSELDHDNDLEMECLTVQPECSNGIDEFHLKLEVELMSDKDGSTTLNSVHIKDECLYIETVPNNRSVAERKKMVLELNENKKYDAKSSRLTMEKQNARSCNEIVPDGSEIEIKEESDELIYGEKSCSIRELSPSNKMSLYCIDGLEKELGRPPDIWVDESEKKIESNGSSHEDINGDMYVINETSSVQSGIMYSKQTEEKGRGPHHTEKLSKNVSELSHEDMEELDSKNERSKSVSSSIQGEDIQQNIICFADKTDSLHKGDTSDCSIFTPIDLIQTQIDCLKQGRSPKDSPLGIQETNHCQEASAPPQLNLNTNIDNSANSLVLNSVAQHFSEMLVKCSEDIDKCKSVDEADLPGRKRSEEIQKSNGNNKNYEIIEGNNILCERASKCEENLSSKNDKVSKDSVTMCEATAKEKQEKIKTTVGCAKPIPSRKSGRPQKDSLNLSYNKDIGKSTVGKSEKKDKNSVNALNSDEFIKKNEKQNEGSGCSDAVPLRAEERNRTPKKCSETSMKRKPGRQMKESLNLLHNEDKDESVVEIIGCKSSNDTLNFAECSNKNEKQNQEIGSLKGEDNVKTVIEYSEPLMKEGPVQYKKVASNPSQTKDEDEFTNKIVKDDNTSKIINSKAVTNNYEELHGRIGSLKPTKLKGEEIIKSPIDCSEPIPKRKPGRTRKDRSHSLHNKEKDVSEVEVVDGKIIKDVINSVEFSNQGQDHDETALLKSGKINRTPIKCLDLFLNKRSSQCNRVISNSLQICTDILKDKDESKDKIIEGENTSKVLSSKDATNDEKCHEGNDNISSMSLKANEMTRTPKECSESFMRRNPGCPRKDISNPLHNKEDDSVTQQDPEVLVKCIKNIDEHNSSDEFILPGRKRSREVQNSYDNYRNDVILEGNGIFCETASKQEENDDIKNGEVDKNSVSLSEAGVKEEENITALAECSKPVSTRKPGRSRKYSLNPAHNTDEDKSAVGIFDVNTSVIPNLNEFNYKNGDPNEGNDSSDPVIFMPGGIIKPTMKYSESPLKKQCQKETSNAPHTKDEDESENKIIEGEKPNHILNSNEVTNEKEEHLEGKDTLVSKALPAEETIKTAMESSESPARRKPGRPRKDSINSLRNKDRNKCEDEIFHGNPIVNFLNMNESSNTNEEQNEGSGCSDAVPLRAAEKNRTSKKCSETSVKRKPGRQRKESLNLLHNVDKDESVVEIIGCKSSNDTLNFAECSNKNEEQNQGIGSLKGEDNVKTVMEYSEPLMKERPVLSKNVTSIQSYPSQTKDENRSKNKIVKEDNTSKVINSKEVTGNYEELHGRNSSLTTLKGEEMIKSPIDCSEPIPKRKSDRTRKDSLIPLCTKEENKSSFGVTGGNTAIEVLSSNGFACENEQQCVRKSSLDLPLLNAEAMVKTVTELELKKKPGRPKRGSSVKVKNPKKSSLGRPSKSALLNEKKVTITKADVSSSYSPTVSSTLEKLSNRSIDHDIHPGTENDHYNMVEPPGHFVKSNRLIQKEIFPPITKMQLDNTNLPSCDSVRNVTMLSSEKKELLPGATMSSSATLMNFREPADEKLSAEIGFNPKDHLEFNNSSEMSNVEKENHINESAFDNIVEKSIDLVTSSNPSSHVFHEHGRSKKLLRTVTLSDADKNSSNQLENISVISHTSDVVGNSNAYTFNNLDNKSDLNKINQGGEEASSGGDKLTYCNDHLNLDNSLSKEDILCQVTKESNDSVENPINYLETSVKRKLDNPKRVHLGSTTKTEQEVKSLENQTVITQRAHDLNDVALNVGIGTLLKEELCTSEIVSCETSVVNSVGRSSNLEFDPNINLNENMGSTEIKNREICLPQEITTLPYKKRGHKRKASTLFDNYISELEKSNINNATKTNEENSSVNLKKLNEFMHLLSEKKTCRKNSVEFERDNHPKLETVSENVSNTDCGEISVPEGQSLNNEVKIPHHDMSLTNKLLLTKNINCAEEEAEKDIVTSLVSNEFNSISGKLTNTDRDDPIDESVLTNSNRKRMVRKRKLLPVHNFSNELSPASVPVSQCSENQCSSTSSNDNEMKMEIADYGLDSMALSNENTPRVDSSDSIDFNVDYSDECLRQTGTERNPTKIYADISVQSCLALSLTPAKQNKVSHTTETQLSKFCNGDITAKLEEQNLNYNKQIITNNPSNRSMEKEIVDEIFTQKCNVISEKSGSCNEEGLESQTMLKPMDLIRKQVDSLEPFLISKSVGSKKVIMESQLKRKPGRQPKRRSVGTSKIEKEFVKRQHILNLDNSESANLLHSVSDQESQSFVKCSEDVNEIKVASEIYLDDMKMDKKSKSNEMGNRNKEILKDNNTSCIAPLKAEQSELILKRKSGRHKKVSINHCNEDKYNLTDAIIVDGKTTEKVLNSNEFNVGNEELHEGNDFVCYNSSKAAEIVKVQMECLEPNPRRKSVEEMVKIPNEISESIMKGTPKKVNLVPFCNEDNDNPECEIIRDGKKKDGVLNSDEFSNETQQQCDENDCSGSVSREVRKITKTLEDCSQHIPKEKSDHPRNISLSSFKGQQEDKSKDEITTNFKTTHELINLNKLSSKDNKLHEGNDVLGQTTLKAVGLIETQMVCSESLSKKKPGRPKKVTFNPLQTKDEDESENKIIEGEKTNQILNSIEVTNEKEEQLEEKGSLLSKALPAEETIKIAMECSESIPPRKPGRLRKDSINSLQNKDQNKSEDEIFDGNPTVNILNMNECINKNEEKNEGSGCSDAVPLRAAEKNRTPKKCSESPAKRKPGRPRKDSINSVQNKDQNKCEDEIFDGNPTVNFLNMNERSNNENEEKKEGSGCSDSVPSRAVEKRRTPNECSEPCMKRKPGRRRKDSLNSTHNKDKCEDRIFDGNPMVNMLNLNDYSNKNEEKNEGSCSEPVFMNAEEKNTIPNECSGSTPKRKPGRPRKVSLKSFNTKDKGISGGETTLKDNNTGVLLTSYDFRNKKENFLERSGNSGSVLLNAEGMIKTSLENSEPVPKRKPGRPRKVSLNPLITNDHKFEGETITDKVLNFNELSYKNKELHDGNRSLPSIPLKAKEIIETPMDCSEPTPKRKPGRPKRISLPLCTEKGDYFKCENTLHDKKTDELLNSSSNNSGSEVLHSVTAEQIVKTPTDSSEPVLKRKRGRPRKVPTVTTSTPFIDRSHTSYEVGMGTIQNVMEEGISPYHLSRRSLRVNRDSSLPNVSSFESEFTEISDDTAEHINFSLSNETAPSSPKKRKRRRWWKVKKDEENENVNFCETYYITYNNGDVKAQISGENLKQHNASDFNSSINETVKSEDDDHNNTVSEADSSLKLAEGQSELELSSKQIERLTKRKSLSGRVDSLTRLKCPNDQVKCVICGEVMKVKDYQKIHLLKHNFISWLEGEEPLPVDDFNLMDIILTRGKRAYPKFIYKCEICDQEKKSSKGFLSHRQFCGKTEKEKQSMLLTCSYCGRVMMQSSLPAHIYQSHKSQNQSSQQDNEPVGPVRKAAARCLGKIASYIEEVDSGLNGEEDFQQDVDGDEEFDEIEEISLLYVPIQRKRVTKHLLDKWKNLAAENKQIPCPVQTCEFKTSIYEDIVQHHKSCTSGGGQGYSCIKCNHACKVEDEMREHVRSCNPPIMVSQSDDSEVEEHEKNVVIPYLKTAEQNLVYQRYKCQFFKPALNWMKQIYETYFSQELLFHEFELNLDSWKELNAQSSKFYNPELSQSMKISYQNSPWESMHTLEGKVMEGNQGLGFTGGPVWALEWCPGDGDQYLAVSSHLTMESNFEAGSTFTGPGLVQLWSLEDIKNSRSDSLTTLQFSYGICHNERSCWSMAWCPSGVRTETRIGLLALATTSGSIPIYAMPNPQCLLPQSTRFYKPEPVIKLELWSNERWQCYSMSWSKVTPHTILAAGFVNGIVAVWDLSSKSKLLRKKNVLYPFKVFQAHHSIITGLCLSPESDSYLATASYDKSFKYWDLKDTTAPHSILKRGLFTSVDWLRHWMSAVTTYDNAYTMLQTSVSLNSLRGFVAPTMQVVTSVNSTSWSISVNDWLNGAVASYDNGQVVLFFALKQTSYLHLDKRKYTKVIVQSSLNNCEKQGEPLSDESPLTEKDGKSKENNIPSNSYGDAVQKYGLAIKTDLDIGMRDKLQEKNTESMNDIYPLASINRISWNNNRQSFLYVAMGYQSGFLVVSKLSFPSLDHTSIDEVATSQ